VLSHDEERRFAEIERRLLREDPGLARRLGGTPARRTPRFGTVLLIVGVLGLLVGTVAGSGAIVLVVGLLPLAAGAWLRRRRRGP
jgi:hypothetical protein